MIPLNVDKLLPHSLCGFLLWILPVLATFTEYGDFPIAYTAEQAQGANLQQLKPIILGWYQILGDPLISSASPLEEFKVRKLYPYVQTRARWVEASGIDTEEPLVLFRAEMEGWHQYLSRGRVNSVAESQDLIFEIEGFSTNSVVLIKHLAHFYFKREGDNFRLSKIYMVHGLAHGLQVINDDHNFLAQHLMEMGNPH